MSVFRGSIAEYPGVVVDNFTNCERGRAFFLSHCHKDHMTGLSSPAIFNTLQRRITKLYCSEVTQSLLLKDPSFTQLAPFLKGLPMEQPVSMTLDPSADAPPLNFTVTLLPAGHCPGSAMFFFQGEKGNVLYTGDFRLTLDETKRLRPLHCDNRVLDITSLYLDTTFCHPIATKIPSRDVSRDLVVNQIDSWLKKDPINVVHLQCGMFGYEHIFMALSRKFTTKIHIAAWKINAYSDLPSVVECLTVDGRSTRIHCCNFRRGVKNRVGLPCGSFTRYGKPPKVLTIKPSTMWFLGSAKTFKEPFVFMPECNFYRVLHSMHASYSELCDFVTYLRPRRIVPCVVPVGDSSLTDVNTRLKSLLPQSEVQVPLPGRVMSEVKRKTNHTASKSARKRSRDNIKQEEEEELCKVECFDDSDNCASSDDTIAEFISSEDTSQVNRRTFSRASDKSSTFSSKVLGLPSMLSTRYRAAIGRPTCSKPLPAKIGGGLIHGSESSSPVQSSDSVTVGSLEQTSLELSEDDSNTEENISKTNATGGATISTGGTAISTGSTAISTDSTVTAKDKNFSFSKIEASSNNQDFPLLQPSLDLSLEDCPPSKIKTRRNILVGENDKNKKDDGGRGRDKLSATCEEEWHLTFDCSSEDDRKHENICTSTNHQKDYTTTVDYLKQLTPKTDDSAVLPPAKRKKRSRERKRRDHHHHHHREHTDLATPVEGEMVATATPRKLFHKKKKERKKHKKSKSERDNKKFKKESEIIDLTQNNEEASNQKAVVTGIINSNDVIDNEQKGKSPTQDQVRPPMIHSHSVNTDHQSKINTSCNINNRTESNSIAEPKIDHQSDSDITFCEELSESMSDVIHDSSFYLPPTPGRENVSSILERKSIAFSD